MVRKKAVHVDDLLRQAGRPVPAPAKSFGHGQGAPEPKQAGPADTKAVALSSAAHHASPPPAVRSPDEETTLLKGHASTGDETTATAAPGIPHQDDEADTLLAQLRSGLPTGAVSAYSSVPPRAPRGSNPAPAAKRTSIDPPFLPPRVSQPVTATSTASVTADEATTLAGSKGNVPPSAPTDLEATPMEESHPPAASSTIDRPAPATQAQTRVDPPREWIKLGMLRGGAVPQQAALKPATPKYKVARESMGPYLIIPTSLALATLAIHLTNLIYPIKESISKIVDRGLIAGTLVTLGLAIGFYYKNNKRGGSS